jgi:hypothetical protein
MFGRETSMPIHVQSKQYSGNVTNIAGATAGGLIGFGVAKKAAGKYGFNLVSSTLGSLTGWRFGGHMVDHHPGAVNFAAAVAGTHIARVNGAGPVAETAAALAGEHARDAITRGAEMVGAKLEAGGHAEAAGVARKTGEVITQDGPRFAASVAGDVYMPRVTGAILRTAGLGVGAIAGGFLAASLLPGTPFSTSVGGGAGSAKPQAKQSSPRFDLASDALGVGVAVGLLAVGHTTRGAIRAIAHAGSAAGHAGAEAGGATVSFVRKPAVWRSALAVGVAGGVGTGIWGLTLLGGPPEDANEPRGFGHVLAGVKDATAGTLTAKQQRTLALQLTQEGDGVPTYHSGHAAGVLFETMYNLNHDAPKSMLETIWEMGADGETAWKGGADAARYTALYKGIESQTGTSIDGFGADDMTMSMVKTYGYDQSTFSNGAQVGQVYRGVMAGAGNNISSHDAAEIVTSLINADEMSTYTYANGLAAGKVYANTLASTGSAAKAEAHTRDQVGNYELGSWH